MLCVMKILQMIEQLLQAGLSQAEIARQTSIPQPTLHRILAGRQVDLSYRHGKSLEITHKRFGKLKK
jgi:DNA-binding IclR family transcriptional regulator